MSPLAIVDELLQGLLQIVEYAFSVPEIWAWLMVILACSSCAEIVEGLQHRRPPAKDTGLKQESQLVNDVVSHLSLRFLFIFFLSLFRDDGNLIVVSAESSARITGRVEHDEVSVFLHFLLLGITLFIVGFQGESYDSLILCFICPKAAAMSWVGTSVNSRSSFSRLIFLSATLAGRKSATAAQRMAASDEAKAAVAA